MKIHIKVSLLLFCFTCLMLLSYAAAQTSDDSLLLNQILISSRQTRAQIAELVISKYPCLPAELMSQISQKYPWLLHEKINPALTVFIQQEYPTLPQFMNQLLVYYPQVRVTINQFIGEKYPQLITDIQALPAGPDKVKRVNELINANYPELPAAIMQMVQKKFPTVLIDMRKKIEKKYPGLLLDLGELVLMSCPELSKDMMYFILNKYPQLSTDIMTLLQQAQATEDANSPAQ